jgi:hypothetical protein
MTEKRKVEMGTNGEDLFNSVKQAQDLLRSYGFEMIVLNERGEHWVREHQHCILEYDDRRCLSTDTPLNYASHVWFVAVGDPDDPTIMASF